MVFLEQDVVDDQSAVEFSEPEFAAKFDFGSGFAADDDVDVRIVKAEDFFSVGDGAAADDALMSLADGAR